MGRARLVVVADDRAMATSRTPVPVPASLTAELSAQIVRYGRHETLLTGHDGRQLSPWAVERAMRTARKKVQGLPAGFGYHDLRHYLASLLIASGADVKTVQARPRHASARPRSTLTAISGLAATSPPGRPLMLSSPPRRNSDGTAVRPPRNGAGQGRLVVRRRSTARTRAGAGAAGSGRARRSACSPARSR
jgi:Phage integrase family